MAKKDVGVIKLHSAIDLKGNIPSFHIITDGKVYDGKIFDILPFEAGSIYIIDRGLFGLQKALQY